MLSPQFKFFSKYLLPHKKKLFLAVFCGFFKFTVPVITAIITGKIIEVLSNNTLSVEQKFEEVKWMVIYGTSVLAVSPLFTFGRCVYAVQSISSITNKLRNDLFRHLQTLSHSYFEKKQSGYLTSRVMSDVLMIEMFVDKVLIQSWMQMFLFIFVLTYFFTQNVLLSFLTLTMLPFQMFFIHRMASKLTNSTKKISETSATIAGFTMEHIANYHVIKCFSSQDSVVKKFSNNTYVLENLKVDRGKLGAYNQMTNQLITNMSPLLVVFAGSYLACFHPTCVTLGILVTFIMLQNRLYDPLNFLTEMVTVVADARSAISRIYEVMHTKPDIGNLPEAKNVEKVRGDIKIENLHFSYGDEKPVLENVNFHIQANTTVAFVGGSGGGKSTITKLLPRFYELQKGSIKIDGIDIRDFKIDDLRRHIGFVPQEPMLFSGTIYENILYGNPNAKKHDVHRAAQLAFADEFILKLPNQYDTMCGERGVALSGGQKQRIAIARAFLMNPSILILDEATSALDNESEALVQKSLNDLMKNRTTIIIAHRLSTIRHANKIFVFDNGKLKEKGTHKELIDHKGKYFELSQKAG